MPDECLELCIKIRILAFGRLEHGLVVDAHERAAFGKYQAPIVGFDFDVPGLWTRLQKVEIHPHLCSVLIVEQQLSGNGSLTIRGKRKFSIAQNQMAWKNACDDR